MSDNKPLGPLFLCCGIAMQRQYSSARWLRPDRVVQRT